MSGLEVLATGPLTLCVDLGRPGYAALGVSPSGAADRSAYRLGQRLLGQGYHTAALEVTFGGLALRARSVAWLALTGADAHARLDGGPVGHGACFVIHPGQELRLGAPTRGLRTYLSVRGGFAVASELGSRSTDLLTGIGPPPPAVGDVLPIGPAPAELAFTPLDFPAPSPTPADQPVLEVVRGPRDTWFAAAQELTRPSWTVSSDSNRVGVRLTGPPLERHRDHIGELASEGVVRGAVQIPASGHPLVFLADHPVTGGYPVIGVLTESSADLLAQARPGDSVRFRFLPKLELSPMGLLNSPLSS